jgi:hypothetical protein
VTSGVLIWKPLYLLLMNVTKPDEEIAIDPTPHSLHCN